MDVTNVTMKEEEKRCRSRRTFNGLFASRRLLIQRGNYVSYYLERTEHIRKCRRFLSRSLPAEFVRSTRAFPVRRADGESPVPRAREVKVRGLIVDPNALKNREHSRFVINRVRRRDTRRL